MLQIRIENPDNSCQYSKPFGLWDDGLRYMWCDTREDAVSAAYDLLTEARREAMEANDRVEQLEKDCSGF